MTDKEHAKPQLEEKEFIRLFCLILRPLHLEDKLYEQKHQYISKYDAPPVCHAIDIQYVFQICIKF